jgi:UDPglucose 6-dehydrogenase
VNRRQKSLLTQKIAAFYAPETLAGKTFAIWGLAFKPKTDDVREAPALTVCETLLEKGARLRLYDPEAMETFRAALGERVGVTYHETDYEAAEGADAVVVCTEWNEFRNPNFAKLSSLLKCKLVFDGRNLFSRNEMRSHGYTYLSIGRPTLYGDNR